MKAKYWLRLIGLLMLIVGVVFTLQGFDVLTGSAMSGSSVWKVLGPVIAAVGLVVFLFGESRTRSSLNRRH